MRTFLIISLIVVLLYLLLQAYRSRKQIISESPKEYLPWIFLTGLLLLFAVFNPGLKEKIKDLKQLFNFNR